MENTAVRRIIAFLDKAVSNPYDPGQEANELLHLNQEVLASAQHTLESANSPEFRSRPENESWYVTLAAIPTERRLLRTLYKTENFQQNLERWWQAAATRADSGAWGPIRRRARRAAGDEVPASQVVAERVFGYLGVLLLVLSTLEDTDSRRHKDLATRWRASPADDIKAADERQQVCKVAVENRFVRRAIIDMFAPPNPEPAEAQKPSYGPSGQEPSMRTPHAWWIANLDFTSLEFYKYGTTSFILACGQRRSNQLGRKEGVKLVLKCVLPAFVSIADIAEATRMYAEEYGPHGAASSKALVEVLASWDRWILMKFVPGKTLEEFLNDNANMPGMLETRSASRGAENDDGTQLLLKPRLDLLELLIPPLLDSLDSLARKHSASMISA